MSLDIIIPTKGKTDYLFNCIDSIIDKTKTTDYHIYVCDTGSDESDMRSITEYLKEKFSKTKNVTLLRYDYYNFAKINNDVIDAHSTADVLLLCNNDIRLIDNCIDRMYHEIQNTKNVGTVGCRLLFKNDTVQHAGQVAFTTQPAGWYHMDAAKLEVTHRGLRSSTKYKDRESVMGNTAAFMMVTREVYYDVGGLVEKYKECFEDVQFNMECIIREYNNIYLDCVQAYHSYKISSRDDEVRTRLL